MTPAIDSIRCPACGQNNRPGRRFCPQCRVILAARIADRARGEEILASNIVRELSASTGDVRFGAERELERKGISGPQRLVRVEWR